MADDLYAQKLASLQQYIPFLENMITQLKDPKKKNREQQLTKMESLYAMITDKKKKLKLETLTKCEEVLIKLYSKVKPADRNVHERQIFQCRNPPEESKLTVEKHREELIHFEAARARLQEVATPDSPSPPRDFIPSKPIVIPTEKIKKQKPIPDDFSIKSWEDTFEIEKQSEKCDMFSKFINPPNKKLVLDELAVKTDMSKPPISVADLKLLQEEDDAGDSDSLSLKELEGIREQIQNELNKKKKDKQSTKEKKSSPSKSSEEKKSKEHHKSSDHSKKPKSPRVEKVIKDSDSIFGNILSSIDEKIIVEGVGKKKDKKKDDKKHSDGKKSESKKSDDKDKKKSDKSDSGKESGKSKDESKKSKDSSKKHSSDSHKHKSKDRDKKHDGEKKETSKDNKDTKNETDLKNKDANPVEAPDESNQSIPTIEPVFRRLADKYNPKPRKPSIDVDVSKPVADAIQKNIEKEPIIEPKIPFLGDTPTPERPPSPARIPPKNQSLAIKGDPRLKQHAQQIPFLENTGPSLPPVLNNVLQQLRGTLNVNVAGNMTPRDPFLSSPSHHSENSVSLFGHNNCQPQGGFGMPNNQLIQQNQVSVSQFNQNQPFNQQHNQFGMQNMFPNQSRNNTYVNTFIVQHNSMNQNQYIPPMNNPQMNNIPINTQMNNIPINPQINNMPINNSQNMQFNQFNQQKKLFSPYEPISQKTDEYDLSKMQPVDFYAGQGAKQPLLSPPFASTSRAIMPNTNRPGDNCRPFANRFQSNDRVPPSPVNEFSDNNRPGDNRPFGNRFQQNDRVPSATVNEFCDNNRPSDNRTFGNRFQQNDRVSSAPVNEFGDKDERVVQQPVVSKREERDPRRRFRDNKKSKPFRREYNKYSPPSHSREKSSREREKESFTSPLDSLYSGNNYQKSGKGYGFQKFKIPKIKRPSPEKEKSPPPPPKDEEKESTEVTAEKESVIKQSQKKELDKKEKSKADVEKKPKEEDTKPKPAITEDEQKEPVKEENKEVKEEENKTIKEKEEVKEETKGESKEDKTKEEESKASQSEQSLLGEFIVNLLGNTNKKDVLVQLFNTLADSLSTTQKKKFKRIQHIADSDSDHSTDEESTSKSKTKKETPKEENEIPDEKPETETKDVKTNEETVEDKPPPPPPSPEKEEESKAIEEETKDESQPIKAPITTRKRGRKAGKGGKVKKTKQQIEEPKTETSDTEDQVVETVGERIKSRKRNPQASKRKARKFRTELDMLHEDIKDMFIRDGVLTATGKRMCRILKDDPQALTSAKELATEEELPSPPSTRRRATSRETPVSKEETAVKEAAKQEDALKRKLRSSNVCVLIEKTDLSKLVQPKPADKESPKPASKKQPETKGRKRKVEEAEIVDTSDTTVKRKLNTAPPKRDSLKRSAKEQTKYNEQEESDEEPKSRSSKVVEERKEEEHEEPSEEEKTSKEQRTPKKKKFKTSWSKGVIKKKAKNTSKGDHSTEPSPPVSRPPTPTEDVASDDGSSSEDENVEDIVSGKVVEGKDAKLIPPDKNYYLNCHIRTKIPCKLCPFEGRIIIQHYKTAHPDQEVLISRLSPAIGEKVIRDAAMNNYDEIEPVDMWEAKSRRKKFNFECHFCQSVFFDNSENFYDHIATHTGEFRWCCTICSFKTTTIKCLRGHAHYVHSTSLSNPKPSWPAPPNYSMVFGYICADCNFVQLHRSGMEAHVKNYHNGRDEFIIKINMSAKEIEEHFEIEKTTAVEQQEEEVVKGNVKQEKQDSEEPLHSVFIMQEIKQEREADDDSAKSKTADVELPNTADVELPKTADVELPKTVQELPKAVEEAVEKPKEKETEPNVFTCETDINQENQRIEEERMKQMEELNEKVKTNNRTSDFVDKLKNRLETIMTTPVGNLDTAATETTNNEQAEAPRVNVIKKPAPKVAKSVEPKAIKVDVEATFVPKSNAPIFSTIQRLQDNLTSNSELCKIPPLKSKAEIPTIARNIKDQLLYKSVFEVRKVNGKITFCCAAPACIVTTDSKESFHNHCQYVHQKLTAVKCTLCQETCDTMVANFEHVIENHWEEILFSAGEDNQAECEEESVESVARPLLRMRRLSGDMLSQARDVPKEDSVQGEKKQDDAIDMEENSGFPFKIASVSGQVDEENFTFPFEITNVVSLAQDEVSDEPPTVAPPPLKTPELRVQTPPPLTPPPLAPIRQSPKTPPARLSTEPKLVPSDLPKSPQRVLLKDHPMPPLQPGCPRKAPAALEEMLLVSNIVHLYKCPAFTCAFSTHNRSSFETHLWNHKDLHDKITRCVYCNFGNSLEHIVIHIDIRHGKSLYSCAYCLFRAVCQSFVQFHQACDHSGFALKIYRVPWNCQSQGVRAGISKPTMKDLMVPFLYICPVKDCDQKFVLKRDIEGHIKYHHKPHEAVSCPLCIKFKGLVSALRSNKNYLDHLRLEHNIGRYVCRYCQFGSDFFDTIYGHVALSHFNLPLDIVVREFGVKNEGGQLVPTKTSKYTGDDSIFDKLQHVTKQPKSYANPSVLTNLSLNPKPQSVLKKIVETEAKQDEVKESPSKTAADNTPPIILNHFLQSGRGLINMAYDEPLVNVEDDDDDDAIDPLSLESEPPRGQSKKKTVNDSPASSLVNEESDSVDTDFETSTDEERSGVRMENYVGIYLFKCTRCDSGHLNSSQFRSHVTKCVTPNIQNSLKPYRCYHCDKFFKSPTSLVDHIRIHGTVKYFCSLCDFKHANHLIVRTHMKMRHKVSNVTVTPVDPKKNDIDKDEFIVRPRLKLKLLEPLSQLLKDSGRSEEEAKSDASPSKISYSPAEINLLPRRAIFSSEMKCAICNYATKVRTNLVRHLEFHSLEKEVPKTAPVNPVPCLEKNEKMFDKMTNLALSSITNTSRMGGKNDKLDKPRLTKEEEAQLPAFVPLTKRYVCGATNCSYLCLEESLLRHHVIALHADETSYSCKHCDEVLSADKTINIDQVMKHLKLHELHLYKCPYCQFVHNLKHKVERHVSEKHLDKAFEIIVVREMDAEPYEGGIPAEKSVDTSYLKESKPWHCGMCKYKTVTRVEIVAHTENKHDIGEQYKCALCTYKDSEKDTFTTHFAEKHPGHDIDIIDVFYKKDDLDLNKKYDNAPFDTTPLWQRDRQRVRHIRGILFDESGKIPKKSLIKISPVPTMDNLDRAIEAVTTGENIVEEEPPKTEPSKVVIKQVKGDSAKKIVVKKVANETQKKERKLSMATEEAFAKIDREISETLDSLRESRLNVNLDDADVIVLDDDDNDSDSSKTKETVKKEKIPVEAKTKKGVENKTKDDISTETERDSSQKTNEAANTSKSNESEVNSGDSAIQQGSELMGTFGPFGEPFNNKFLCPLCAKFKTRNAEVLKSHLYDELQYTRYKCRLCQKTSANYNFFHRHFQRKHNSTFDPANVIVYPQDKQIELWVTKVLSVQGKLLQESKDKPEDLSISDDEVKCLEDLVRADAGKEAPCASATLTDPLADVKPVPELTSLTETDSKYIIDESTSETNAKTAGSSATGSPKKYNCAYCSYSCKTQNDVRRHEKRHWLQKPFKCGYCEFEGIEVRDITNHSRVRHKNLPVKYISVPMPSTPTIVPVVGKRKHVMKVPTSEETTPEKKPKRESAGGADAEPDVYKIPSDDDELSFDKHADEKEYFLCAVCDRNYDTQQELEDHHNANHVSPAGPGTFSDAQKRFKCSVCNHTSDSYLSISRDHVRSHFKPYECTICHKRFNYLWVLNSHHSKVHQGLMYVPKVLEEEKEKCAAINNYLLELQNDGTYKKMKKKRPVTAKKTEDFDDLLVVQKTQRIYTARKHTGDAILKNTARKSTAKPQNFFSYYGTTPQPVDMKGIVTTMKVNETDVTMNVEQLSRLFNIFPRVTVVDCMKRNTEG